MAVVEKREQQRHRHGFEPGIPDRSDHTIDLALVERGYDLSLRIDPLGDLKAPAARHQHRRRVLKEVVEVGARRPAQLQHVTEAARDDRRSSSTSRKPRVATNPALAPFFSISALVTIVVACANNATSLGATRYRVSPWRIPSITPWVTSRGVVGALATPI